MIVVASYLKFGEDFILIGDCKTQVPDREYVDGAIELTINEKPILTKKHWDLVDSLWAYILHGITEIVQGNSFETYFPDQPIRLSFDMIKDNRVKVSIQASESISTSAPIDEFVNALTCAGELFCQKMIRLNPAHEASYTSYAEAFKEIRDQMALR